MRRFEVIMAGGGGSRFWPLSRRKRPKQLLNITGRDILINETICRLDELIEREHVYIVTNEEQQELMKELLVGGIPFRNILVEPVGRNTAPCILYAAERLNRMYGDCVVCVCSSDHHIANEPEYRRVMDRAMHIAEHTEHIVTIGIKPTYASTGYGYIRHGDAVEKDAWKVSSFVEKPDTDTARAYVDSGEYTWNSGVFISRTSVLLAAFEQYLPDMTRKMGEIVDAVGTDEEESVLKEKYPALQDISIDYGIMERADNVLVMEGDYGWSDVGSFDALDTVYTPDENGNISIGDNLLIDSRGCTARSQDKLVAVVGADNLIVVESEDAILVCPKERAQDARKAVEALKTMGRTELI